MTFNEFTNDSLPSDLKVTARGGRITIHLRTATVVLTPDGARAMADAINEVTDACFPRTLDSPAAAIPKRATE
ncbi:hypothetical protein X736_13465 [Mesorhizobium sp. L2C089B000]|nr:hypothetical protein X736_13465 [Mesorhizobium sp. L2C089B000]ESZ33864.1 hypothetical protein X733_13810 [Mesorhizobium sp. L2C067A000]